MLKGPDVPQEQVPPATIDTATGSASFDLRITRIEPLVDPSLTSSGSSAVDPSGEPWT